MTSKYYTLQEFAQIMKRSTRSIYRDIKNGRVRAFKVGLGAKASFRIPHSEMLRIETVGMHEINPNLEMED